MHEEPEKQTASEPDALMQPEEPRSVALTQPQKFPWVTGVACGLCILVFLAVTANPAGDSLNPVLDVMAPSAFAMWGGKYWGLLTSAVTHTQLWHVFFNVYWWWYLGAILERKIGPLHTLGVILVGALISSGAQFAVGAGTGIGASGVVYALFGYLWVARMTDMALHWQLPEQNVKLLLIWLFVCLPLTWLKLFNVGNAAHFGGFLFGAGWGWIFERRTKIALFVAGELVLLAVSVMSLFWCPWSVHWVSFQALKAHQRGAYQQAISWYQKSLAMGQEPAWVWHNLFLAYHGLGDSAKQKEALDHLRHINPQEAEQLDKEIK